MSYSKKEISQYLTKLTQYYVKLIDPHSCGKCGKEVPQSQLYIDYVIDPQFEEGTNVSDDYNVMFFCEDCAKKIYNGFLAKKIERNKKKDAVKSGELVQFPGRDKR